MNYDKKGMERIVLIGALASFIFICGALMHEGIQIVAQEQNRLSEATTGRIGANLSAGDLRYARDIAAGSDIHNSVSTEQAGARSDMASDDGEQAAVRSGLSSDGTKQTGVQGGVPTDGEKRIGVLVGLSSDGEEQGEACQPDNGQRQADARTDVPSDDGKVYLPKGRVVRGFGWQEENGVWRYHTGVDIAVEGGSDVCAAAGGTVRRIERGAGGYLVEVAAQDKLWLCEPLAEVSVAVGDSVRLGEGLGRMAGSADRLHIACRRGDEWLDPQRAVKQIQ